MSHPQSKIQNSPPPTLIESWLPIEAIGVESQRERGASSALPPLYFLHVWWARRPLITSRAAILAGLLPPWSEDWPDSLRQKFPTKEIYHAWFQRLLGILGDPVAGRKLIQWANQRGTQLKENPYGGAPRAFIVNPSEDGLVTMLDLLEQQWDIREIAVMDPMAGGGSIPFEALRYGFTTLANELNPVASVVLKATLDFPARFGPALTEDIRKWGGEWAKRMQTRLAEFFPKQSGENIQAYIWARTIACPSTGKVVPLSPHWWLSKEPPIAVSLRTDPTWNTPQFETVRGDAIDFNPDEGTISRGVGRSPWTGEAIDGDYIKREAQAGRMGQLLYAIVLKQPSGFSFRAPTEADLAAASLAEETLAQKLPSWEAAGFVPTEPRQVGRADWAAEIYGLKTWATSFAPRQLLSLITFLESMEQLGVEIRQEMNEERAAAVETYLGIMLDKAAIYNNRSCRFDPNRGIRSIFDRHDFGFVWSHAEFDASANLLPWVVGQVADAYKELAKLTASTQLSLWNTASKPPVERLQISQGSATDLNHISSGSVHHICVDPPYYDNVMYAELSDFFYVWLKRSVGHLYPDFFRDELTNKDDEAVANAARFAAFGAKKKPLAQQDYERKMVAAFREMHRVLRDDGVLTVMFTHKQVEAWDTLATALIGAGFTIKASWPVHTESEHSLHQAKKNAAASTILLVCRKRPAGEQGGRGARESFSSAPPLPRPLAPVWWDDIKGRVRSVAREKAAEFAAQGIGGVDLYISTFGPVLAVISEQWPVLTSEVDEKSGQPKPLRPEIALDLAREEVIALRKQGLLLGRDIQFDPITDWYLMAWDAFKAEEFPADEARKLALALGLDVEKELIQRKRVISKKSSSVVLQQPKQRRRKGLADPEADSFDTWLDAAHAVMLIYEEDGATATAAFLKRTGLASDGVFKACLQALLNAIPRTRLKGKFVRPEAEVLDNLRLAFFEELIMPVEEEREVESVRQLELFGSEGETDIEEDKEEEADGG
ncbi:MAG: DUF1156 domain-containing protein [Anaerolineae bacterium]|nr:DUF1156 domain-containing protein [Anaerolineae bacterium]